MYFSVDSGSVPGGYRGGAGGRGPVILGGTGGGTSGEAGSRDPVLVGSGGRFQRPSDYLARDKALC